MKFIQSAVSNVLWNESWSSASETDAEKRSSFDVLVLSMDLHGRRRRSILVPVSGMKREAQDITFCALRLKFRLSRYVAYDNGQKRAR